jgi:hypothetical protein
MTEQRQREVESLARSLLSQALSITPDDLAQRANINWFLARDVLQGLARKGLARALTEGGFGPVPHAMKSARRKRRHPAKC